MTFTEKIYLDNVTLVIVDCVNLTRAIKAYDHCKKHIQFQESKFFTHFDSDLIELVKIDKISSIKEYSDFLMFSIDEYIKTSHFIVCQWDGFVWNPHMWDNSFLQYDYIGAPWIPDFLTHGVDKRYNVGNGGFSLRSKRLHSFLRENRYILSLHTNEDVSICQLNRKLLEDNGFVFAPLDVAERFSWESGKMRKSFGIHRNIKL